ncbi:MAG: glycosyltransferase [Desulfamplus sp.]|nr:glycosyltransferase [Desulfamplus sp.]
MKLQLSVIIPAYNAEATLSVLLDSLEKQTFKDFEIIVVDDCSQDATAAIAQTRNLQVISIPENRGPAFARNAGARNAVGEILVFTDSDCCVEPGWLHNIHKEFSTCKNTDAIMGKLKLSPSNLLGNSISALGFPAGGSIGFEKIWKVEHNGYTESLSTCNCALRKDIFWKIGGFDTSFPYAGGEDSLLAYHLVNSDFRIKYCPNVIVYHDARDSFTGFIKWQFRRGISSYIFSTKIANKKSFYSLRIWSSLNIIKYHFSSRKFPLVISLLGLSYLTQIIGYLFGKTHRGIYEKRTDN